MNCERRTNALETGRSASLRRSFARGRLIRLSSPVLAVCMSSPIPGSWKQTSRFSWAYCFQTGITHRPVRARRRHSPEHKRTYPGGTAEAKCVPQITVTLDVWMYRRGRAPHISCSVGLFKRAGAKGCRRALLLSRIRTRSSQWQQHSQRLNGPKVPEVSVDCSYG